MPYGYSPMRLEQFGGLNTLVDPTNLPPSASPDCQDVEFVPGQVQTRPGLTSIFAALGGNPTVNYLKTYITPTISDALRMLVLDSLGILRKEDATLTPGTLSTISSSIVPASYANSVSLFGREYIAIGDGQYGIDIPRQYDDTNFDRVSQEGPGAPPGVADENIIQNLSGSPNGAIAQTGGIVASPNGLSQVGFLVTVKLTIVGNAIVYCRVGDPVQVTGAGVAGYNGTWTITAIIDSVTFQYVANVSGLAASGNGTVNFPVVAYSFAANSTVAFTNSQLLNVAGNGVAGYNTNAQSVRTNVFGTGNDYPTGGAGVSAFLGSGAFGLAASGGGTVANGGSIVAGLHKVNVIFQTRSGYLTPPSPASSSWTASGSKRAVVTNIPLGPPNTTKRILVFTAAGGASFFYQSANPLMATSSFFVADNTTVSATVDFSDASLLSGTNADALFNLLELGECAGVAQYSSRLFWWGERNKVQNFNNLSFDGGFSVGVPGPLPNFPLGWTQDVVSAPGGASALAQGQPVIFGDAYEIVGNGSTATRGLITQTAYQDAVGNPILSPNTQYSVRARIRGNRALTQGTLHIHLFSSLGSINTTGISLTAAQTNAVSYTEVIAVLGGPFASIPSDLVLRVYVDGTPIANDAWLVDCIEVFPTNQPINTTIIRASKVEDPESYDGTDGLIQPAPSDGQAVRCCFVQRNNFYMVKDRKLYVTQDDGVNEPSEWTVQEVSNRVGTLSIRGVGEGDEWHVIAGESGCWLFTGAPLTDDANLAKEIQPTWNSINWALGYLVDVKVDTKRKRIHIAVPLGASATANNRILTLDYTEGFAESTLTGIGRKWSIWQIACNSMNMILRNDGTQKLWFGNGTGLAAATGKVYQLDTTGTVFTDDGAKINDYWQSGYFQDVGRLVFGPLVANVVGVGTCNLILRKGDQGWVSNLRGWLMSALGFRDMERNLNIETERLAIRLSSAGVGDHFSLQGVRLYAKEATWAPIRGVNAA